MTAYPATEAVVRYALSAEAVPSAADRARLTSLVLDFLGVAVAGTADDAARVRALTDAVARPDGPATIVGTGAKAAAADAASVNAFSAHLMEFDDSTLNPVGHPSVTVLPAVLAVAEQVQASGRDLLTAYAVGLEVHARLGQAMPSPWSSSDPFLPIGTIGTIGAAVAAGRLLGLDAARMAHAIGLAAQSAGQLGIGNGSHAKPLAPANAAASAVRAAQLAAAGFTGPAAAIERPGGFADVFLRADSGRLAEALTRLGGQTHLSQVGVAVKRYPSCYGCHFSVDGLRQVMAAHAVVGPRVRGLRLTYPADAAFLDDPTPDTVERARFSMQFGLAVTLLDGFPQPRHFTAEFVAGSRARAALARVSAAVRVDDVPPPARWRHEVAVETVDGDTFVGSVARPHGHPKDPLDPREIVEKFAANVAYAGLDGAQRLADAVGALDRLDDVRALLRPLAVTRVP